MASHGYMSLQTLNKIAGYQVQLFEPRLSYWDDVHSKSEEANIQMRVLQGDTLAPFLYRIILNYALT